MEAAIRKVIADPANAAAHAQTLLSNADTNWAADDLVATVADFVDNGDKVSFVSGTGPYAGDVDAETQLWLTTRDEATWKQVIATVEAGGRPDVGGAAAGYRSCGVALPARVGLSLPFAD